MPALELTSKERAYLRSLAVELDTIFQIGKGGITEEEWNDKLYILKDEERKREYLHSVIKKWANDLIPFLMILFKKLLSLKGYFSQLEMF